MTTEAGGSLPHLIIRPESRWRKVNLRELWQFRDLFFVLGAREVTLRYRQTALGIIWVILQPLLAASIFAFVFGRVAKLPSDGVPYFLFAYTGFLAWNIFQGVISRASPCLIQNTQLVTKTFFPRILLPLSVCLSVVLDFLVGMALLFILIPIYGVHLHWSILLLPVWLLLLLVMSLGIGLYAAALVVSYRDVQTALPVLLQLLLYGSPVAYGVAVVPARLRELYMLNPLAGLIEAMRWSLLGTGALNGVNVMYAGIASFAVFGIGVFAFTSMERRFADVI
jgi:lipopolysaccharide transport system permease protein